MHGSGAKILIVEDEFLIRLTLAEALRDEGFQVSEAGSGEEALPLLAEESPIDLLVTDMQLGGALDGTGLAQAARRRRPALPVVFMTGRADGARQARSPNDAFVAKPYVPSDISAAARRLIGRRDG